jgi:hypothetical protein
MTRLSSSSVGWALVQGQMAGRLSCK